VSIAITSKAPFPSKTDLALPKRMVRLAHVLSPAERDRASRFHLRRDRNHFIARRGILREMCSAYLAMEATKLAFDYGPWGKPYLSEKLGRDALRFSVSHSYGVALYALTAGREVGIDIERVRSDMAWQSIAPMCLSTREVAALRSLPSAGQAGAFFTLWTRKETYVKARGTGLSTRLSQIDVLGGGTYSGVLARAHGRWQESWSGSLQDLDVGQQYVAALAAEEPGLAVVSRRWSGSFSTAGLDRHCCRSRKLTLGALPGQHVTGPGELRIHNHAG